MEIRKLRIHNVASIEDCELDFADGLLSASHLILICGPTGAGKTTIMDAICLALYKKTPRINAAKVTQRYEDANTLFADTKATSVGLRDTRHLMRKGSSSAEVELEFVGNNGYLYIANWTVKKARTGTIGKVQWTWENVSKAESITRDNDIEAEISVALGLDFEQFCRASMLAQGEFDKFLSCEDNERAEILEKLTDTSVFSKMGKLIYDVAQQKGKEYEDSDRTYKALNEGALTQAEIENYEQEKAALDKQKKDLKEEAETKNKVLGVLKNIISLKDETHKLESELAGLKAKTETDEYKAEEKLLTDWPANAEAMSLYGTLLSASGDLSGLEAKKQAYVKEYSRLCSGNAYVNSWLNEKESELKQLQQKLAKAEPMAHVYMNMAAIRNDLAELLKQRNKLEASLRRVDKQYGNIRPSQEAFSAAKDYKAAESIRGIEEALSQVEVYDIKKLSSVTGKITAKKSKAESLLKNLEAYEKGEKDLAGKEQKKKEAEESAAANAEQANKKETELKALEDTMNSCKERYDKLRLSADNFVDTLRSKLVPGDECPVCGRKIEGALSSTDYKILLEPLSQELEGIKKSKAVLDAEIAAMKSRVARSQGEAESIGYQLQKDAAALEKLKGAILAEAEELELGSDLQKLKQNAETLLKKLGENLEALSTFASKLTDLSALQKNVSSLRQSWSVEDSIATNCYNDADALFVRLDEEFKEIPWREDFCVGQQAYIENLEEQAKAYSQDKLTLEKWQQAYDKTKDVKDMVDGYASTLEKLYAECSSAEIPEAEKADDLQNRWKELIENAQANVAETNAKRKLIAKTQESLDEKLNATGTDIEYLKSLKAYDSNAIQALQESHGKDASDIKLKEQLIRNNAQKLEENSQKAEGHEVTEKEELEKEISGLNAQLEQIGQQIAEIQVRLKANADLGEKLQAEKLRLDALQKQAEKWKAYSDMFGSYDGGKFRKIAQAYVFKELLSNANYYLDMLGKRYALDCDDLLVLVRDDYEGGAIRPVPTLSGGEKFIVSLSLALALSGMRGQGSGCNMLFIDEGFGTLSGDNYLDIVVECLQKLHYVSGQRVVIISHVESLRERIPTQIRVKKKGRTASEVEVVG